MAEESKLNIVVNLISTGFKKGAAAVTSGLQGITKMIKAFSIVAIGRQLFQLGAVFVGAAAKFETVEKSFDRSFAGMAKSTENSLKEIGDSLNRNMTQLKQGSVAFNSFFNGLGFQSKEAAKMSVSMQKLSLDLASFFGLQDENAQKRFLAALAGSPEVLDQFGINLKQAALQEELFNMGLKTTVQNTSEVIKTQGRLNIIMRSMTDSGILGDAERSMDTYDGTLKQFDASWVTFSETLGDILLPAVIAVMDGLSDLLSLADKIKSLRLFGGQGESKELTKSKTLADIGGRGRAVTETQTTEFINKEAELAKLSLIDDVNEKLFQESKIRYEIKRNQEAARILTKSELGRYIAINQMLSEIANEKYEGINSDERIKQLNIQNVTAQNELRELAVKIEDVHKEELRILKEKLALLDRQQEKLDATKELNEEQKALSGRSIEDLIEISNYKTSVLELDIQRNALGDITNTQLEQEKAQLSFINTLLDEKIKKRELERQIADKISLVNARKSAEDFEYSLKSLNTDELSKMEDSLWKQFLHLEEIAGITGEWGTEIKGVLSQLTAVSGQLNKMTEFDGASSLYKVDVDGKSIDDAKDEALTWIDILRPITDAASQLWTQMLTPPDGTISKEEQKEKTMAAFAGIMVGLGQALFSLGMGALLAHEGLKEALSGNVPAALIMMATGTGLIALGKGQLQKAKNSQFSREGGGSANSGGAGGQSMTDFMSAVQGEQVFRLAGNDLVTAINRSNTFQGTIGG
jgi:hypothetical protein